jgi:hypothetical protein
LIKVGRQNDGQHTVQEIQLLAAQLAPMANDTLLRMHRAQIGFHDPSPRPPSLASSEDFPALLASLINAVYDNSNGVFC